MSQSPRTGQEEIRTERCVVKQRDSGRRVKSEVSKDAAVAVLCWFFQSDVRFIYRLSLRGHMPCFIHQYWQCYEAYDPTLLPTLAVLISLWVHIRARWPPPMRLSSPLAQVEADIHTLHESTRRYLQRSKPRYSYCSHRDTRGW